MNVDRDIAYTVILICRTVLQLKGQPLELSKNWLERQLTREHVGKEAGPSGIRAEMLEVACVVGVRKITDLVSQIICEGTIQLSGMAAHHHSNCYKGCKLLVTVCLLPLFDFTVYNVWRINIQYPNSISFYLH